uniref:Uncharacterized protein n=1 Tax=Magallana gigas TaxID=29159 RepID=K1QEU7_MAGGI
MISGACFPAMAESVTEEASKPGFGMRLAISSIARRFPSARNVSTHWLDQRLHGGQGPQGPSSSVKILDCRAEDEYNISHIEGAVRINYESSPEELLKLAEIDLSRKDAASTNLSVYNLEGSLFKWANENRHMVNIRGETTKFAHPYNASHSYASSSILVKFSEES